MKLGETVAVTVLKACSYVGASLFSPCVPRDFGGRTGSKVSKGYVFHWGSTGCHGLVRAWRG